MKLYTEEQLLEAYDAGWTDFKEGLIGRSYYVISQITPIELPSDEEIEDEAINKCLIESPYIQDVCEHYFQEGAKWMKEQILNQNK